MNYLKSVVFLFICLIFSINLMGQSHPNLMLTKANIAAVRQGCENLPLLNSSYKNIKTQAEKALFEGINVPTPKDGGGGYTHEQHKKNYTNILIKCIFVASNENVFLNVTKLIIMTESIHTFVEAVAKKNPNEPEFLQAVKEVAETVIPFIEKNYRVATDANSRALAGLSMGGLQTLHAGVRNTNMFSYLGVFSSGWWSNQPALSNPQYEFMKTNASTINTNLKQFWIAMGGKEDIAWKNCQTMMERFDEMKIKYTYSEYPGGHTWPVWRNNLYNFAQLLFR